jgi:hypothetical protein
VFEPCERPTALTTNECLLIILGNAAEYFLCWTRAFPYVPVAVRSQSQPRDVRVMVDCPFAQLDCHHSQAELGLRNDFE